VNRRFLQALGLLALLALTFGSLAALFAVREKLEVTIARAQPAARGPDPIDLLRGDVAALQADVLALSEALGQGLQAVHDGLDESAALRDQATRSELSALQRELALVREAAERAERASVVRLEPSLHVLEELTAAESANVPDRAAESEVQAPPEAALDPTSVASTEEAGDAAVEQPAEAKRFLAFRLPSQAFAFDRAQRFEILPALSRVGFDAQSTLHDFSGATQAVQGELQACLARPDQLCRGSIEAQAGALDTGEPARDAALREHLITSDHPQLRFQWTIFEAEAVDPKAMTVRGTARGRMSVRGVERDFSMPVRVAVDASKRVSIDGEAPLDLEDFHVPVPNKLGVISMQREVKVWIALRMRVAGTVAQEGTGAH
jgi:polyisoprenoid-binding protein YceI